MALSRPGPQCPFERPVLLAAPHCAEKAEASASNTALGSGKNQLWWKSLIKLKPNMVAHACHLSNLKAETGGLMQVRD